MKIPSLTCLAVIAVALPAKSLGAQALEPKILQHPEEQMIQIGHPGQMSVTAQGTNLNYQWIFRYQAVIGATNPVFSIPQISVDNVGLYQCAVFNELSTVLSSSSMLSAYSTNGTDAKSASITVWSYPYVWPGNPFMTPDGSTVYPNIQFQQNLNPGAPLNVQPGILKKPRTSLDLHEPQKPEVYFAALRRTREVTPQAIFISATNSGGTVFSPFVPIATPGTLAGCGSYLGYVNIKKSGTPAGWSPVSGVPHNAQDPNRTTTCIRFFGSFSNNGVGTGGFVDVTPITSTSYQFTVFFPVGPVPTEPYSLVLNGFVVP